MPRLLLFSVAVLAVLRAAPSAAEAPRFDPFWNVEITGSALLSHDSRQALPVIQYTRQDIERSGALKLSDFIQSLPQQVNGLNDAGLAAGLAKAGPLSTALRGLAASTLVLLNGKRLPRYARATVGTERTAIDLDMVPLEAVSRIDVLTDGASTRYGSDAVAGVINIVTDALAEGWHVQAQANAPTAGHAASQRAHLGAGIGQLAQDGWDLQAHVALDHQAALRSQDRASTQGLPRGTGTPGEFFYMPSLRNLHSWPATVLDANGQPVGPLPDAEGRCASGWFALAVGGQTVCRYNMATDIDVYPAQTGAQLYALGRMRLGAHLSAFAELAYSQRRSESHAVAANAGPWSWVQDLGGGQTAYAAPLPLGPGQYRFDHHSHRLALGLQGLSAPWRHQTTLSLGRSHDSGAQAGLFNRLNNAAAWDTLGIDAEALTQPELSADTLAALQQGLPSGFFLIDQGRSRLDTLEAVASRRLAETDAGDVSLALGASWSRESIWTQTYALGNGRYAEPDGPAIRGQRHSGALHAELEFPLRADTTLGAQIRHDHHSDIGAVTTGKLALRHQHNRQVMWRASYGSGFRAPTLEQVHGTSETLFAETPDGKSMFYSRANPDLRPEQSRHFSAGLRLEPSPRWSLGLDYWRLNIRDGIQVLSRTDIDNNPSYAALYRQATGPDSQRYTITPLNLARRTQAGIDYDIQWRQPTSLGRLRLKWHGTWFTQAQRNALDGGADLSEIGELYDGFNTIPRHQVSAQLALERPQHQFWLTLHYRSGNREPYAVWDSDSNAVRGGLYRRVPGHASWDLGWRHQASAQTTWTLMLLNIADQAPPYRYNSRAIFVPGIHPGYGDYRGRTLAARLQHRF
jgi:iron complex outermembrane receptor protein